MPTTIPNIDDLPEAPSSTNPSEFNTQADAFVAALVTFCDQLQAAITAMNTVAGEVEDNAESASDDAGTATAAAATATTQAGIATTKAGEAAASAAAALVSQNAAAASAGALSANANTYRTVDVVATTNKDISTALAAGQTIDGITLTAGMRVLLAGQSTGSQNGIYDAPASGAASRSADSNSATLMPSGMQVAVTRGTAGAGSSYVLTTAPGYTLGTTALTFARRNNQDVSSAGAPSFSGGINATPLGQTTPADGAFNLLKVVTGLRLPAEGAGSSLTGTTNDLSIGSMRWGLSATTPCVLTGIAAMQEGDVLMLRFAGSNAITLKHQNTNSSAANRLSLPNNADLVPPPNTYVILVYRSSRWEVLSGG